MTSRGMVLSSVLGAAVFGACGAEPVTNEDPDKPGESGGNGSTGGAGGFSTGGAGGASTGGFGGVSMGGSGGTGTSSSGAGGAPIECVDIPPPPGQYTCEQQAGWGKCNEPWMQGYCLLTCGVCPGACVDIPPPPGEFTCAQQVGWGKCNEPWMQGYCLKACGDCMPGGSSSSSSSSGGTSSSSSGGGSSSSGGPVGVNCGHDPVDPAATPEARKLLCYLYSIYGNHVLAGQQEQSWDNDPDIDNNYIQSVTGKFPALRGQDFLYQQTDGKGRTTTSRAIDWWQAGGISQMSYHMGNPGGDDSYGSSLTSCGSGCIADALTPGTFKNQVLKQRLDHAATELGKLQAANVAVIWRPWHESNGKWFWWGMEGGAEFGKLFRFTYDYFVNVKGLHNLVWEVSWAQPNPDNTWDPGKAYYDLAGPDTYDSQSPFAGQYAASRNIVGNIVPISLQENGLIPDPAQMFNANLAPWLFWNTWTQFEYEPGNQYGKNPKTYTIQCYSDPHTITRDMVPNLK